MTDKDIALHINHADWHHMLIFCYLENLATTTTSTSWHTPTDSRINISQQETKVEAKFYLTDYIFFTLTLANTLILNVYLQALFSEESCNVHMEAKNCHSP